MDRIEQPPEPVAGVTAAASRLAPGGRWRNAAGGASAGLAALGLVAAGLALAKRRATDGGWLDQRGLAPADRTLAWASPAVLGKSPRRRFYAGTDPASAVTIEDLRAMAHRRLPGFVTEYLEAGGEDEAALARNIAALAEWRFLHRSMVDVSRRDVSTVLFGSKTAIPLAIAPTGFNGLFWPHADLRLAEAAAEAGVPFAQSTMSNDLMARIARVPGLRYWWQLYVFGPDEVRNTLISRACENGCEALIVTVDAQIYGNREWHHRTMASPTAINWSSRFDALMHPRWLARGILTHGMPKFDNVVDFVPKNQRSLFDSAHWIRAQMDKALDWDTIARIRERWPRKLVIKGLLTVEDCIRAAGIGGGCGSALEPWRPPARLGGRPPRSVAGGAPRARRADDNPCRWRHPARHRRDQGAGTRRRCGFCWACPALWRRRRRQERRTAGARHPARGDRSRSRSAWGAVNRPTPGAPVGAFEPARRAAARSSLRLTRTRRCCGGAENRFPRLMGNRLGIVYFERDLDADDDRNRQ